MEVRREGCLRLEFAFRKRPGYHPRQIRNKLNLKQGDLVVFVETDNGVMVKPASVVVAEDRAGEVKAIVRSIRERFTDYSVDENKSWCTM